MSRYKGWIGEKKIALKMWMFLNKNVYPRFHDVILPYKNGTSQIDHVIVSQFGVFIIETKNKEGWIYGSADRATWTQTFYKKKFSFQNPLRQTYRQKKVLAAFLDVEESSIYDLVYFIGKSTFKTAMPVNVMNAGLSSYIKRFQVPLFSPIEVEDMVNKIKVHISNSTLTTKDHIQSIKERKNSDVQCPRCGEILVMRTVKKGVNSGKSFLGCSAYPKCRFSKEASPGSINDFHKSSESSSQLTAKPTLQQWLQANPGKGVNDYYLEVGE